MALYHFSAQIISRSKGQSACAAAAYRSGEQIENEYDGIKHDYRNKENIEETIIMLPVNAPVEFTDLKTLWNTVEQNEKQANAQLAREIEIALPNELSKEERNRIAMEFVQENLVNNGMIAQLSFHNKPHMNSRHQPIDMEGKIIKDPERYIYNNPHIHILMPLRPVDEKGKWEAKRQKIYVCEKNGHQRSFTPAELKENPGWEKLYNYVDASGKRSWLTKTYVENHPEFGLTLVNRYPKSESIVNPTVEKWNSTEFLMELREAWAKKVNMAYAAHGMEERVDHRSYEDQGLDLIPTIHEGKAVTIAEKRLKEEYDRKIANGEAAVLQHTDVRNMNNDIREHNQEIKIIAEMKRLREQMAQIIKPVKARIVEIENGIAEKLEILRAELISLAVKIKKIISIKGEADEKIRINQSYINDLQPVRRSRLETLRKEKLSLQKKYEALGLFSGKKREELETRIELINNEISILLENRKYARKATQEIAKLQTVSDAADTQITELRIEYAHKDAEYIKTEASIPVDEMQTIKQTRETIRPSVESQYLDQKKTTLYIKEAECIDTKLAISETASLGSGLHHKQENISWG